MTFLNRVAGLALALMVVAWPARGRGQEEPGPGAAVSNVIPGLVETGADSKEGAAGGGNGGSPTTPPDEKLKDATKTLAEVLAAYGTANKIAIRYMPDSAKIASANGVTVKAKNLKAFPLDNLNKRQLLDVLTDANLVLIEGGEVDRVLNLAGQSRFVVQNGKPIYYIGSNEGELVVLRRDPQCIGEARNLLTLSGAMKALHQQVAVEGLLEQIFPSWKPDKGPIGVADLHQRLSSKILIPEGAVYESFVKAVAKFDMPLDVLSKLQEKDVSRLLSQFGTLYPAHFGPAGEKADYPKAGITVGKVAPISLLILEKLLGTTGNRPKGWGVEWVPVDKGGRFVVDYNLQNVWANEFEYQRAFVPAAAQPTLKVWGIKSDLELAVKDYIGGAGIGEEGSAAAPVIEKRVVPSLLVTTEARRVFDTSFEMQVNQYSEQYYVNDDVILQWRAPFERAPKAKMLREKVAARLMQDAFGADSEVSKSAARIILDVLARPTVILDLRDDDVEEIQVGANPKRYRVKWWKVATRSGLSEDSDALRKVIAAFFFAQSGAAEESLFVLESMSVAETSDVEVTAKMPKILLDSPPKEQMANVLTAVGSSNEESLLRRSEESEKLFEVRSASSQAQAAKPAEECKKEKEKEEKAPDPPKPAEAYAATPQLRGGAVQADVANNSVMVVVPKTKAAQALKFMDYLEQFITDLDRDRKMVEISVAIVDTEASIAEQWGVRFAVAARGTVDGRPAFGVSGFQVPRGTGGQPGSFSNILNPATGVPQIPASTVESTALTQGLNVGALIMGSSVDMLATLRAMEGEGKGRVLSRPSLLTTDNSEAVLSEETKFYLPASGLNTGTLAEVPVGLKVVVTPQIVMLGGPGEKREAVRLRINLKEGTGSGADSITGLPAGVVAVDNSQFKTVAVIEQGQSLMVAGRLRHDEVSGDQRVPVLGKVPVLGRAFKSSNLNKTRQQRMILITPVIVDPATYHHAAEEQAARVFLEPELPRVDQAEEPPPAQTVKKKQKSSAK